MSVKGRAVASAYLEWAKLHSAARFNLATSGIMGYRLSELGVRIEDLEINGPTKYGYEPLQERLALKCAVTPECVVAANGTAMANHLAMAATIEPGDDVLVEQPTYGPLLEVPSYLGANIMRFERRAKNDYRVDPDDVKQRMTAKTRLIVLTNLHNPSGARIDEETLGQVGAIAAAAGARVLVDEAYLDMVYDPPVRSAFHMGPQFVVTTSLTKPYGLSGLRCGYILAEPELAMRMWRLDDLFGASPVHPAERLSVLALNALERIHSRAKGILATNRKALEAFYATCGEVGGFHSPWGTVSFPRLLKGSVDEFCELLRLDYETSVVPGRFFETPNHFRIGIGGDPAMTAEGLDRLGQALREYAGTG
jgi:aspartate/methionine/tyrosine aminotransferase